MSEPTNDTEPAYLTQEQMLSALGITEAELVTILVTRDEIRRAAIDRSPGVTMCVSVPNEVVQPATFYGMPVVQGPAGVLLRAEATS